MKLLYHHRTKSRDGQAVHIRSLIAALRSTGHEVLEWALSPGESGDMGSEGGLLGRLAAGLPRGSYELAEHAYGPLVAGRLARAGREAGCEVLYERHALNNTAGLRAARRLGIPLLLEVNSPLAVERSDHETLVFQRWAASCERAVFAAADRILVVTEVLSGMLQEMGVDPGRIVVIPNGADLSLYPRVERPEREQIVVGFTGFFRPWHGLEGLVEALGAGRLGPRVQLLLVGDGPSREGLQARIAALGLESRVTITGAVERAAIPELVASMDVCVQPAATAWASPLKLFEYMAAGCAIVAPDQANLREVLTDGVDARMFRAGAPDALAEAVSELVHDDDLRRRLGAGARSTLEQREYTWEANARRVVEAARACLGREVAGV